MTHKYGPGYARKHALSHVRDTLTDLIIEAETVVDSLSGEYEPPRVDIRGSLHGLNTLYKVKTLPLPWFFVMGTSPDAAASLAMRFIEPLPPNVEVLALTDECLDYEMFHWRDDC